MKHPTHTLRRMFLLLVLVFFISRQSPAQQVNTSTSDQIFTVPGFPIIIDDQVTLTSLYDLTGMTISIVENYKEGDVIDCAATLPAGITKEFDADNGQFFLKGTASAAVYQALLRQVTFYTTSLSNDQRKIAFSIGKIVAGYNGHYYEFVPGYQTWKNAKTLAEQRSFNGLKGYLATITSQEENDVIVQKLSANGWIGASDAYEVINAALGRNEYTRQAKTNGQKWSEGSWYWVTGPEAGTQFMRANNQGKAQPIAGVYSNWNDGEPNNYSSSEHFGEIYSTSSSVGAAGKWNDFFNNNNSPQYIAGYVVEYGGIPDPDAAGNLGISMKNMIVVGGLLRQDSEEPRAGNNAPRAETENLTITNPINSNLLQVVYQSPRKGKMTVHLYSAAGFVQMNKTFGIVEGENRIPVTLPPSSTAIQFVMFTDENGRRIATKKIVRR